MVDVITRHQVTTQDKGPTNGVLLLIGVIGEKKEKRYGRGKHRNMVCMSLKGCAFFVLVFTILFIQYICNANVYSGKYAFIIKI